MPEALEALRGSGVRRLPGNRQGVCRVSDSCKKMVTTIKVLSLPGADRRLHREPPVAQDQDLVQVVSWTGGPLHAGADRKSVV